VRHKSVNPPLSHERLVGGLQDGGRGTHVTHFVQLHVSIVIQIIFRELVGSLLKSMNLKIFKNVKGQLWCCCNITFGVCAWPRHVHTPKYFFSRGIHALPKRWNTCTEHNGDHVEKLSLCALCVQ